MNQPTTTVDTQRLRDVLGNYPTGVSVITAIDADGSPTGMAVGTFTSVSLDPPLVGFLPDKSSSSFPRIRSASSFCINVLGADQEHVCRAFARRGGDKFAGIAWTPAGSGAPRLDGTVAWIDCDFDGVSEAGDHYFVTGSVRDFGGTDEGRPLVFFQGGYGRFAAASLVAVPEPDVTTQLRHADLARPEMERLAADLAVECVAVASTGEQLVVVAGAGLPASGTPRCRVGHRSPLVPPLGSGFLSTAAGPGAWPEQAGNAALEEEELHRIVDRARQRGWSLALAGPEVDELQQAIDAYSDGDRSGRSMARIRAAATDAMARFEPDDLDPGEDHHVRLISAPVVDGSGTAVLLLTLWGLPRKLNGCQVRALAERLVIAAARVSEAIVRTSPAPPSQ